MKVKKKPVLSSNRHNFLFFSQTLNLKRENGKLPLTAILKHFKKCSNYSTYILKIRSVIMLCKTMK